jgi:sec-independent protein translocase protein TatB
MGGLGPGIGGMEYVVIAVVALLVVGPERLPAMLRKLGKMVAKARNMANEFRSSFDEMARQSELDELRKEVDALRRGQSNMMPLGAEAEATFKSIRDDLNKPVTPGLPAPAAADLPAMAPAPDEWPDSPPVLEPLDPAASPKPVKARKARTPAAPKTKTAPAKTAPAAQAAPAKPRGARKKAVEL